MCFGFNETARFQCFDDIHAFFLSGKNSFKLKVSSRRYPAYFVLIVQIAGFFTTPSRIYRIKSNILSQILAVISTTAGAEPCPTLISRLKNWPP
jgi:hypothetical protein